MNLRQRILVAALVFSCLIGHTIYGTGSDDVSIDEDVSQCFEELSISNGTSLVVKTSLYEDFLFSKVSMKRCRRVHPGKVFVLGLGETLHFHAPDVWEDLRLTFFQPSDTEKGGLPLEFRQESKLLLLNWGESNYFISPSLQRAFSTNDNSVSYFKFPYKSIWRNRAEYEQWTVTFGCGLRPRRRRIEERARHEREFAEALYRRLMAMPRDLNLVQALQGTGSTNVQIAVAGELTNGIHQFVQNIQVRVDGSTPERSVCGVRFEYADNGRNTFRYRYDRAGRLRWFSSERAVPGDNGETVLADPWIFEYNEAGTLLRAFDSGPNPLLVITDRTFYFSIDDSRIRPFLDAEIEAMRGIR